MGAARRCIYDIGHADGEKGSGKAGEIIVFMDDKVKRALEPLKACLDRIEQANPDKFS